MGLSLGGALGGALSSTLRRLDESEAVESKCCIDDAAAGVADTPPCTPLQERVMAAAPLLARAVGSLLASHALLPLHSFSDEDDENVLCTACAAHRAAQLVTDGRRFVVYFCRAFEATVWRNHATAESPGEDNTSDAAQSLLTRSHVDSNLFEPAADKGFRAGCASRCCCCWRCRCHTGPDCRALPGHDQP